MVSGAEGERHVFTVEVSQGIGRVVSLVGQRVARQRRDAAAGECGPHTAMADRGTEEASAGQVVPPTDNASAETKVSLINLTGARMPLLQ
jgi:hypothetical protein